MKINKLAAYIGAIMWILVGIYTKDRTVFMAGVIILNMAIIFRNE